MKRRNGKVKKAAKSVPPTNSTRLLSAVLLVVLAVLIGVVLAALESIKL